MIILCHNIWAQGTQGPAPPSPCFHSAPLQPGRNGQKPRGADQALALPPDPLWL